MDKRVPYEYEKYKTTKENLTKTLDKYGVAFDAFDIDKNNRISWDEYATIFTKHHGDKGSDA